MKAKSTLQYPTSSALEEDALFWRRHIKAQVISGLARSKYCRQHQIDYHRLGYWSRKFNNEQAPSLVAVKLKPDNVLSPSDSAGTLCTLVLKNECQLRIHDQQTLLLILERCSVNHVAVI
jgi:hypothetical protein